jgi:hypothetical protein
MFVIVGTQNLHKDAKLQELKFPPREVVRGVFPAFRNNVQLPHQNNQSSTTNETGDDESKSEM